MEKSRRILNFYPDGKEVPAEFINSFCWYVIHVRSRHEFKVLERLTEAGINAFLPVMEKLNKWKDRKKLVKIPLFSGYIFVYIIKNHQNVLDVLRISGVVKFLSIRPGEPDLVPEEQIVSLKRLVESKQSLDPYPYLKEGQRVRIKSGSLAGVEGILSKKAGHHILILSVDILQQGVSLKIEASDVERV